jgi:hypothetical protein
VRLCTDNLLALPSAPQLKPQAMSLCLNRLQEERFEDGAREPDFKTLTLTQKAMAQRPSLRVLRKAQ